MLYDKIEEILNFVYHEEKGVFNCSSILHHFNWSEEKLEQLIFDWSGVSSQHFFNTSSLYHIQNKLQLSSQMDLFDNRVDETIEKKTFEHGAFCELVEMTPKEYENDGENLKIHYSFYNTPFGKAIVCSSPFGICYLAFVNEESEEALTPFLQRFKKAKCIPKSEEIHKDALAIFDTSEKLKRIKLHVKGTAFQFKVWNALLSVPWGTLTTYHTIAKNLSLPTSSRPIGTAIGRNPIAFLVPCHRVVQSSGGVGGYMWGFTRKIAMIGWEENNSITRQY